MPLTSPYQAELVEPAVAEWTVGALAVAYEEASDRILLVAEELILADESDEDDDQPTEPDPLPRPRSRLGHRPVPPDPSPGGSLHRPGRRAGRVRTPICPLCGRPIDPEGHACPRLN